MKEKIERYVYIKRKGIDKLPTNPNLKEYLHPEDEGKKAAEIQAEYILDDFIPSSQKSALWR